MAYPRKSRRQRASVLVAAAAGTAIAAALAAVQPVSAAHAPSCTNAWANPVTGNWTASGMWNLGHVPASSEDTCIAVTGNYNVNLTGSAAVKSLLVQSKMNFASLVLDSTGAPCGSGASLTASNGATIGKHSALLLISSCVSDSMLNIGGTGLGVQGELIVFGSSTSKKVVSGSVVNDGGLVDIDNNQSLEIDGGGYTQTATARLAVEETGGLFSTLAVPSGTVSLTGTLTAGHDQTPLTIGQTFSIITAKNVVGTFTQVFGDISGAKYLLPKYSATGVSLVVMKAELALSPKSGPAGTAVTVSGSNYPPNDVVTLSFKGAGKVTAALGTAHTDSTGAFSQNVTIPADAQAGKGHVYGSSGLEPHMKAAAAFSVS